MSGIVIFRCCRSSLSMCAPTLKYAPVLRIHVIHRVLISEAQGLQATHPQTRMQDRKQKGVNDLFKGGAPQSPQDTNPIEFCNEFEDVHKLLCERSTSSLTLVGKLAHKLVDLRSQAANASPVAKVPLTGMQDLEPKPKEKNYKLTPHNNVKNKCKRKQNLNKTISAKQICERMESVDKGDLYMAPGLQG